MIRDEMTSDERAMPVRHYIDPGFVNLRLVETVLGQTGVDEINRQIALLPELPEWLKRTRLNHIYTRVVLAFCDAIGVPTLGEVLAKGKGRMFCSTENLAPTEGVYESRRLRVPIVLDGDHESKVELELSTEHISSDTLKMQLSEGQPLSVVAVLGSMVGNLLTFRPLIIGSPWLEIEDPAWTEKIVWWGHEFYENFPEDFDEFADLRNQPVPTLQEAQVMEQVSEKAFKTCLAEILGDEAQKDWGGESSDHFAAHLHLRGRPVSGAFLLKGPAKFSPMTLNMLGKNNDQIYRLANDPADVLFVQHCHEITPPVRGTLRAFAVQPSRPRRYCLIDGRESLRLLRAYGKLDRALELSRTAA